MALSTDQPPKRRAAAGIPIALFITAGLAAAGILAGWLVLRGGPRKSPTPVLTEEARAYVRAERLQLSDVSMIATDNFARQTLVEITGKITNTGNRRVKVVEIKCVFYDPFGRVVLRERVPIVSARMGGLKPGETKSFRLPFDAIPESWNQTLPELVVAQIVFD
ncbi:MAG: FxLYD domain-containing protein [Bryobacteraceae bacterium]|jgi:hypothetical protein